jgi:hypothetical protein
MAKKKLGSTKLTDDVLITSLNLATETTGTLGFTSGGTGQTSYTDGQLLIGNTATGGLSKATLTQGTGVTITNGNGTITIAATSSGTVNSGTINQLAYYAATGTAVSGLATANNGVLVTSGTGVPSISTNLPTAVTIGTAYIYRVGGTDVSAADGGTGQSSYTIGDILYASGAAALSKLAAVADGNVLRSAGVGTAPAWGKVNLSGASSHVTGTLAVGNGGTGLTTGTQGGVLYFSNTTTISSSAQLTANNVVIGGGTGAPSTIASGSADQVLITGAPPTWGYVQPANLASNVVNLFASISWGTPGTEVSNAIEVTGTALNMQSATIASTSTIAEIRVSDSASATATLTAAGTPDGTIVAGSGTATLVIQTSANGTFAVKVTETAAASRYLWVNQGNGSRTFVRANSAPLTLTFA